MARIGSTVEGILVHNMYIHALLGAEGVQEARCDGISLFLSELSVTDLM